MKHLLAILLLSMICFTGMAQMSIPAYKDTVAKNIYPNWNRAPMQNSTERKINANMWNYIADIVAGRTTKAYVDSLFAAGGGSGGAGMAYGNPIEGAGSFQLLMSDYDGNLTGSDQLTAGGGTITQGDLTYGNILQPGGITIYGATGYIDMGNYPSPNIRFLKYGAYQALISVTDSGLVLTDDEGTSSLIATHKDLVSNVIEFRPPDLTAGSSVSFTLPAGKELHSITIYSDLTESFDIGFSEGSHEIASEFNVLSDIPKTLKLDNVYDVYDDRTIYITKISPIGDGLIIQIRIW